MRGDVTDVGRPITEDRATQPMEAGGGVSQYFGGYNKSIVLYFGEYNKSKVLYPLRVSALWMKAI